MRWLWVWLPITLFLTCMGWAALSPVGSSPDDDYHLSSIWCGSGTTPGRCEEAPGTTGVRLVPEAVVDSSTCYRYHPEIDAGCQEQILQSRALVRTDRVNVVQHLYPNGYYRVMSLLVSDDVGQSVFRVRLVNALIACLLLLALLRVLPPGLGSAAAMAVAVTFVPLGLSIVASTNPSSWTVTGIAVFWAASLGLIARRGTGRGRVLLAAIVVVSAAMAIASRVDGAAYVAIASGVVLALAGWAHVRRAAWRSTLVVGAGAAGLAAFATHGSGVAASGTPLGTADAGLGLLLTNAAYLPALFQGVVGGWNLGWNDVVMPPAVPVIGTLVVGALVYRAAAERKRGRWAGTILAAAALVAVPLTFLQLQHLGVGEVVQPRYILPLLTLLVGALGLGRGLRRPLRLARGPAWLIGVALTVSATLAFWANAHRYLAGSQVGLFDPRFTSGWALPLGLSWWVIAVATVLATAAFVAGCAMTASHSSWTGATRRLD